MGFLGAVGNGIENAASNIGQDIGHAVGGLANNVGEDIYRMNALPNGSSGMIPDMLTNYIYGTMYPHAAQNILTPTSIRILNNQNQPQTKSLSPAMISPRVQKPVSLPVQQAPKPTTTNIPVQPTNYNALPQFSGASEQAINLIVNAAQKYGVPVAFAAAVANHETGGTFNPLIHSYNGDGGVGLFQITPGSGNAYADALAKAGQLNNPVATTDAGMHTLADALKLGEQQFGNNPNPLEQYKDAYMIFNAGPDYTQSSTPLSVLRQRAQEVLNIYTKK